MILLFVGCLMTGPDLPEGWEDAERIEDFTQAQCGDTGVVALTAVASGDGVELGAGPVNARCAQDLEAYWQGAEVLVQPVDMEPDSVAKCGCAYDLSMLVPTPAPVTLDVYQRTDRYGGDGEPEMWQLGTVAAE